jgi:hypothetical protein
LVFLVTSNSTETWLAKRAALIDKVYGGGPGVLPTRAVPDQILTWPEEPGLQGLVWNMTTLFEINSTVFYSPVEAGKKAKSAFLFHHGHSNCICPMKKGDAPNVGVRCRPGCNSSMPSLAEVGDHGYTWWDLYNVSAFFHSLGHDVFILSMPLKGVNVGPGSNTSYSNQDHWWFYEWEKKGDAALRYFLEPAVLTVNYAKAQGYEEVFMAGLSGGGWSTTFAAAIDKRIDASFPIAGSVPCALRNPESWDHGQNWTGDSDADFEQNCRPNFTDPHPDPSGPHCRPTKSNPDPPCPDAQPGRPAFAACNYTCQYLLAGLEPGRFQVQVLHEYDTCCFSPHARHDKMLKYESEIRAELMADDRQAEGKHGWFTVAADNHSKHEVCDQDKTIITAALAGRFKPNSPEWQRLPCDIMHQPLPANCAPNRDPGLPPGWFPCVEFPTNNSGTWGKLPCCPGNNACCRTKGNCPNSTAVAVAPRLAIPTSRRSAVAAHFKPAHFKLNEQRTPAATVLSALAVPISSWTELDSAVKAAAGTTATLTLSPSFTMAGYLHGQSCIDMEADGTVVTIEGHGATFDAAGKGSFFFVGSTPSIGKVSLTVKNVTMKNGYDDSGGAVGVGSGSLTLDGCTLVNNTNPVQGGGALIIDGGATPSASLIKGCKFVGPISRGHNDIQNYGSVTFACADGEVGAPVHAKDTEITVIPPKELQCTAGKYVCHNGGKSNWQCVEDSSGISWPDCQEVCSP